MASRRNRVGVTAAQPIPEALDEVTAEALAGEIQEDPDNPVVSEGKAKALGSLSPESVSEQRRIAEVIEKKRSGQKNVGWGIADACLLYDAVTQVWPPSTMSIHVTLLATKQTFYVYSRPRDGQELYEALLKEHNKVQRPDCEYQVAFQDRATKYPRGQGRITLSANENDVQVPPVQTQSPQGYGMPGQGMGYIPPQYPPQPPPPPSPQQGVDPYIFNMLQKQLSDMAAQLSALQRRDDAPLAPPPPAYVPPPPPPPPTPSQSVPQMPDVPPGYALTTLGGMPVLVPLSQLGLGGGGAPPVAQVPSAPVAPAATTLDQFTSTIATVRSVLNATKTIQDLLPSTQAPIAEALEPPAAVEMSDVKTEKLGDVSVIKDAKDGSIRPWETMIANGPAIMNWVERQRQLAAQAQAGQGAGQPPQIAPQQITPQQGYAQSPVGAPTIPGR